MSGGAQRGSAPHVVFDGVSKSYGSVQAVRHLDLEVRRGEFLTLLGPSGSGKTTALMMLAGFEQPSGGQILLDGQRIDRLAANKRNIGLVFQNYALFPHMTVAENLAYPLKVRRLGRPDIADRVAKILDLVQLPGLGARRPDQLSGGQQQRVAVARALIFEPQLVLMDEPLGALDKQLREQMQFELKAIHARLGVTFIYVTHDQTEALTLSDRIAVFSGGVVQQVASPRDLYERPATGFVAGFIGENNRLSGRIETLEAGVAQIRLAGGALIRAAAAQGLGLGAEVMVSVRPERVRLLGPSESAEVDIAARLREVIYVGDHLRLLAQVDPAAQASSGARPFSEVQEYPAGSAVVAAEEPQSAGLTPGEKAGMTRAVFGDAARSDQGFGIGPKAGFGPEACGEPRASVLAAAEILVVKLASGPQTDRLLEGLRPGDALRLGWELSAGRALKLRAEGGG